MSIAALIFASAGISFAQNAAPAADAPAKPDAPKVAEKSIADMWRAGGITMYPCVSKAVAVARKIPFEEAPNVSAAMKKCEDLLGGKGRILVRYSGTEKKIRLLAESPDPEKAQKCMSFLLGAAEIDLK